MRAVASNMHAVKKQNRTVVLDYINEHGPVSRKEISEGTKLAPGTVTTICNKLLEQGLLIEEGASKESSGAGRRKIPLSIAPDYCYILAVILEKKETQVVLSDLRGGVVARTKRPTDRILPPEEFLKCVAQDGRELLRADRRAAERTVGTSVAISGLVDTDRGVSIRAYGIWDQEVPVCDILERELGMPAMIENNINAFAQAELAYGVGRHYNDLLVVRWDTGMGASVIVDGEVYKGNQEKSGEIGHFIVEPDGPMCSCGRRGCLEALVSYHALQRFGQFQPDGFEEEYCRARAEGRSEGYDHAIELIARTIINAVTLLSPDQVVLCGRMFSGETVREKMLQCCFDMDHRLDPCRVLYTELASREDYIGPVAVFAKARVF